MITDPSGQKIIYNVSLSYFTQKNFHAHTEYMKSSFFIILLTFLFSSLLQAEPKKEKTFHVVIDPGHGGELVKGRNDGSQGSHGASYNNAEVKLKDGTVVLEKDIVLEYAKALKTELEKIKNVEVTLTRSDDSSPSAMMRAAIAVEKQADVFLCLHFNSGGGKGPRAYVVADDHFAWQYVHFVNPYITRDIVLATHIVKSLELAFKPFGGKKSKIRVYNDTVEPRNDHGLGKGNLIDGIRTIGYARIDSHLYNAAVVLLEVEFLDTKNYSEFLTGKEKDKVKLQAARYMAKAIEDYKKAQVLIEKPIPARR